QRSRDFAGAAFEDEAARSGVPFFPACSFGQSFTKRGLGQLQDLLRDNLPPAGDNDRDQRGPNNHRAALIDAQTVTRADNRILSCRDVLSELVVDQSDRREAFGGWCISAWIDLLLLRSPPRRLARAQRPAGRIGCAFIGL